MPWCPKCKNEFQEGYSTCSDCKVDLVDELPVVEEFIPFFQSEAKSIAEKLAKYFSYSDLKSVIRFNDELGAYIVFIPSDQRKAAQKLYQAFYFVERERHENGLENEKTEESEKSSEAPEDDPEETEDVESDVEVAAETSEEIPLMPDSEKLTQGAALYRDTWNQKTPEQEETEEEEAEEIVPATYVLKAEKYKDYHATVGVFLGLGFLGVIFVLLNITGVLSILNGIIPNTVMGALFLFFITVGISTQRKAKELQLEIEDEKKITEQINEWLSIHVTNDYLNSLSDETLSAELNYIRVTDIIKEKLLENFPGQNADYLDRLIEDFYNANFDTDVIS